MSIFRLFKNTSKKTPPQQGYHDPRGIHHGEPQFSQPQQHMGQGYPNLSYPQQQVHQGGHQGHPYQGFPQTSSSYGAPQTPQGPQLNPQGQDPYMRQSPSFGSASGVGMAQQQPNLFAQSQPSGTSSAPHGNFFQQQPPANHPQQSGNDLRGLKFWDTSSSAREDDFEDEESEEGEGQPLRFVFALGILIIFAALAWLIFKWSTQTVSNVAPHIQADQKPYKVRPDHPGGIQIPHQDKLIYGKLEHQPSGVDAESVQGEHILPPPEPVMQPAAFAPPPGYMPPPHHGAMPQGPQAAPTLQQGMAPQGPQPYHQAPQGGQHPQYPQQGYALYQGQPQQAYQQPAQPQGPAYPAAQQQPYAQGVPAPQAYSGQNPPQYVDEDGEQDRDGEQFYPNNMNQPQVQHSTIQPQDVQNPQHASPQEQASQEIENIIDSAPSSYPTGTLGVIPKSEAQTASQAAGQPLFKARVASLPTKKAAEQEWDRLKRNHGGVFKGLSKSIQEQTVGGKKYHVLYVLGFSGEAKAKEFCKKLGNNCAYTKQQ